MTAVEKFWIHIGNRLEEKFGSHPKVWKAGFIKEFLENTLQDKLKVAYKQELKVRELLKVSVDHISTLIPSYDTFRRIFKTAESTSKIGIRNLFAIYLDKIGYIEYLSRYKIKGNVLPPLLKEEIKKDNAPVVNIGTVIHDMHRDINIHINTNDKFHIISENQEFAIISENGWNFRVKKNQGDYILKSKRRIPKILTILPKLRIDQPIGRSFSKLEKAISQNNQIIAIQGEKGIGKTTFVQQFLERHKQRFNHIAWLNVESTIEKTFAKRRALTDSLLINPNIENTSDRFQQVTNVLRQLSGNNLLVLDNVGQDVEHTLVYDNIKLADNWSVIVTTEEDDLEDFITIPIKPFSKNQLIGLFEEHYNKPCEYPDIEQVIQLVQSNTKYIVEIAERARKLRLKLPEAIERIKNNGLAHFLTPFS